MEDVHTNNQNVNINSLTWLKRMSVELRLTSYHSDILCEFEVQLSYDVHFGTITLGKIPDIGMMVRVFAIVSGDLGSIPGRVIPKTQNMVHDASTLNIQHYKVRIKDKVQQSKERRRALPYSLM